MKLPKRWFKVANTPTLSCAMWYGRYVTIVAEYQARADVHRANGDVRLMRSSLRFARKQAEFARTEYADLCRHLEETVP